MIKKFVIDFRLSRINVTVEKHRDPLIKGKFYNLLYYTPFLRRKFCIWKDN
jgi:hypothetical protein